MTRILFSAVGCIATGLLAGHAHASVLTAADFAATPDQSYAASGDLGSVNDADLNGDSVSPDDQLDALFEMSIDFSAHQGGDQVVFEFGGAGRGVSLIYGAGNTLTFGAGSTDSGGIGLFASYALSAGELAAGNLAIAGTINLEDAAGQDMIGLFVNGVEVASASGDFATDPNVNISDDWSGADEGGFGSISGANGSVFGFSNPPSVVALSDGVINGSLDVTVTPVPEPGSLALLGLGAAALIRRRR